MKKNILRVVALLLVVCLMACFPLKAKASSVVTGFVIAGVSTVTVVGALLVGMGFSPGSDSTAFNNLVEKCSLDLGLVDTIQGVAWAASGFNRFAVPYNLLESVRNWLFGTNSDIFVDNYNEYSTSAACSSVAQALAYASHCPVAFTGYNYKSEYCIIVAPASYEDRLSDDGTLYVPAYAGTHSYYVTGASNWVCSNGNMSYSYENCTRLVTSALVSSASEDFVTNDLIDDSVATADAYPSWIEGVVHVPGADVGSEEESIPYIPTGVASTYEETIAQTKEQVQTGETTIDVTVEIPDDTVAGTKLGAFFASLVAALSWSNIKTWIEGIWTSVLSIPDKIAELPASIAEKFTAFWNSVTKWLEDLHTGVISLPQGIADTFTNFWNSVTTWLENLHTGVTSIPQAIADVLADVFIPAEDYISVKVEALAAEYAFVPDIVDSVTLMKNNLVGDGGPPVIYVDFGRAGGNTNYGGKVLLTDFAWYEEYKPTVDTLMSAALWSFFLWRAFLKLPGIIGGESGSVDSSIEGSSGVKVFSGLSINRKRLKGD